MPSNVKYTLKSGKGIEVKPFQTQGVMGVAIEGFSSGVTMLGNVCTGRLIQSLIPCPTTLSKELSVWIELLQEGNREDFSSENFHNLGSDEYIFYKPQMLIAVTTSRQTEANEVLLKFGFKPSQPVINTKYNTQLINWTYALQGWVEPKGEL